MKIGILGGTFNPIHNAHLQMAALARDALSLDRVLLMVAADPPHKRVDGAVAAADRYAMARLAAETCARVEACDLELCRDGKSYTADTLAALKAAHPDTELFLIVGSDMLTDLPSWHAPGEILDLARLAYVPRRGQDARDTAAAQRVERLFDTEVIRLPREADELSSTLVRERMENGLPVSEYLPAAVERYCYEYGLYFPAPVRRMQAQCRAALHASRYRHTMGVVRTAAELAETFGAEPERARIAALLHDCAKDLDPAALEVLGGDDAGIRPVWHAFAGAVLARMRYGVTDDGILRAIRLHSTGDANMGALEMLTYLADAVEPNRDYPGVDALRKALLLGPERAMLLALRRTRDRIVREGGGFHPLSRRAIDDFEQRLSQQE